jgi:phosphopantetheinyl transferase
MSPLSLYLAYGLLGELLKVDTRRMSQWLTADERAELIKRNYKVASRSLQFIYGRLLLKVILSRALGVNPHALSIRTGGSGQPLLLHSGRLVKDVSLSVSHDQDRLLVAAGMGCQCGVDIQTFKQVDWPLVMRAMGWSDRIASLLEAGLAMRPLIELNHVTCTAMIWSAYEAWMKATACSLAPSDFAWQQIRLVSQDAITQSSYFEMTIGPRRAYNPSRVLMSLRADEVLAIATITV